MQPTPTKFLLSLVILFIISLSAECYSEELKKDSELEKLLKNSNTKAAKSLIDQKLNNLSKLSSTEIAYYNNRASNLALQEGSFDEALVHAKKAESALSKSIVSTLHGENYRSLCFAYIRLGNLDSGLVFAKKLYDFSKNNKDTGLKRSALMAMGNISLQNKKYTNSLKFYLEALETSQNSSDSTNLKVDLYNVGLAYATLNDRKKSNEYLFKAVARTEKEGDKRLLARIYGTIADNFMSQKNYKDQIYYLNKANELAKELNDFQLMAMGFANAMETSLKSNDFKKAIELGNLALNSLEKKPIIQLQAKLDSMMFAAFKGSKDYDSALFYLEKYDFIKENIRNEKQKQKLEELTLSFEVERKNLKIESQEAELKNEKTKARFLLLALLSAIIVLSLMIYIYIKNSRSREIFFKKEKEMDFHIEKQRLRNLDESFALLPKSDEEIQNSSIEEIKESEKKHKILFLEIMDHIEKKKLYLDPDLSQKSLVNILGTNRQYLYEAIHKSGEENFRGLINRLRINEAKGMIEKAIINQERINFSDLNELVGFKSYSTYRRAFKGLTGLTPNEYAEEFRKTLTRS
jgi:YesN/AraC family two-component response regulator